MPSSSILLRWCAIALALLLLVDAHPGADEGMWTFDNPPRAVWKERYRFEPGSEWLDRLRLSIVRLAESTSSGTAAFVSPEGLVITNQHVVAGSLQKLSTPARDLVRDGYTAGSRVEELKAPDLTADVLVSFEEVTSRVHGAVTPGAGDAAAASARRTTIAAIERESQERTGLRSEVVALYNGGEYWLYRYKRYADVRLVFAPEEQMAYFGGDADNFTFPRHDLDVAFMRVYENGVPARTDHYLRWSPAGATDGEFVVLAGYPGTTDRLLTVTQIRYQRDVGNPLQNKVWASRRAALSAFARTSPEAARRANAGLRSLENSLKRLEGQQKGIESARLLLKKEQEEQALRAAVMASPPWSQAYGHAWDRIDAVYAELPKMAPRIAFSTLGPSAVAAHALSLVRYQAGREGAAARTTLMSEATLYPDLEEAMLAGWLDEASRTLGADDPFVKAALQGRPAKEIAREAIAGTRLFELSARKQLVEGGAAAIRASNDPLLALARRVDPIARQVQAWRDDHVRSVEASAGAQIASARFAVYGRTMYPDANFTLRLGFGRVLGYEEDATLVPWKTTFFGLFDRAASFDGKPPYELAERWRKAPAVLEMATPFNFAYTGDTVGGNSGSPIVNREGEFVGINFDSNQQKLANRYAYIDESDGARAIGVHSRAIVESLTKLYGASRLVAELQGSRAAAGAAPSWRQWGGPNRNFTVTDSPRLAETWPASGPPLLWSRPLGNGHSTILVDEGRLYTMYRVGEPRRGPWQAEEIVVCMDAATGKTLWEYKYPSRIADFSRGAGPHATPLIVGDRLFTSGTNLQFHAFDKRSGKLLWSHDLVAEYGAPPLLIRPVVKSGHASSPIAFRDTVITMVGGPGQSLMAFRQSDGALVWKHGDYLISGASPLLITLNGREQLIVFAGSQMTGVDPENGRVLWAHPHDPGNDFNFSLPLFGADNVLFMSSGYRAGSRAIQLTPNGATTSVKELWFNSRVRFMFLNAIRIGDHVYGTSGDMGPAFLTALNLKTGQPAWQNRGFAQATLVHADGKTIILDEDGDLALTRLTPEGATILSQVKLFDTVAWTVPTLAGTTLYARDREKIVALDLGIQ
jgi:outer membrane protein assembly factor BamB